MRRTSGLLGGFLAVLLWGISSHAAEEAGVLSYTHLSQRMSVEVRDWPLDQVLERLAQATHWQILVEPGIEREVTTRFQDLPVGKALRRLFGPLSFAYVPGGAGSVKLLVFSSEAEAATRLVATVASTAGPEAKRIEDELILRVKPGFQGDIEELARSLGAKVVGKLDEQDAYRLKFGSAEAAESARNRLASRRDLDVQDNYLINRPNDLNTHPPFAIPSLGLTARPVGDSDRVVVAVIDTAIQSEGTVLKDFLLPGISVAGDSTAPADTLSHGTSMATTILNGVAAGSVASADGTPVRILPVDVYGGSESSSSFALAQGIQAAILGGADLVNLSLGGDGASPLVADVIRAGQAQGVVFVAAAGNEPVNTPTYPAAFPEVVAVTAMDRSGNVAAYANYGDFVDLLAPGLSFVPYQGQSYYVMGTSAAANTTGQAANLIVTQGLRGAELEQAIRAGGFQVVTPP
jgi:hypothetical protein